MSLLSSLSYPFLRVENPEELSMELWPLFIEYIELCFLSRFGFCFSGFVCFKVFVFTFYLRFILSLSIVLYYFVLFYFSPSIDPFSFLYLVYWSSYFHSLFFSFFLSIVRLIFIPLLFCFLSIDHFIYIPFSFFFYFLLYRSSYFQPFLFYFFIILFFIILQSIWAKLMSSSLPTRCPHSDDCFTIFLTPYMLP